MFHLSETDKLKAKADALRILTINTNMVLADRNSTRDQKEKAVLALMSIQWTPGLARMVGSTPINKLLKRFKNDIFSTDEYKVLRDTLLHATDDTIPVYASAWRIWHDLIIRYHLFEFADTKEWVSLVARFDAKGIRTPHCLARIPFEELSRIDWECSSPDLLLLTWQAAKQDSAGFPAYRVGEDPPSLREFQNLIDSIRMEKIDDTAIVRDFKSSLLSLGLPPDFEGRSAAKKMAALRESNADPLEIANFLTLGAKRNTLRAFAGSLRPAASGMQSYLNFCEFEGYRPFPVQTDVVLKWSNMFQPGRTMANYTAHLMKATILLKQPTDWMCPDIRAVIRGLANAQDLSFKFENFLFATDLLRLLKATLLTSEFGCAAYFSYLFMLRVPSETLQIRKASPDDKLTDFTPQPEKILMGVRTVGGHELLIAKFSWRKNIKRGCILRRPCLCQEQEALARVLCPVHRIWPRIADQTRIGELLFPSFKYSFNRHLRANLALANIPQAEQYSSHCFRRGSTQELQIAGNPDALLKRLGCWRGMGFRSYIDTQLTDALKISRLISRPKDSDSDGDPDSPVNLATEEPLRKKLRPFPGRTYRS